MINSFRSFVIVGVVAVAAVAFASNTSHAQVRVLPNSQAIVNPYYRVAPGLPLNQAAYNIRVLGRAYGTVPPWAYGYNPYPAPIITTPYYYTPPTALYYYAPPTLPYYYSAYPTYPYPTYGPYYPY